MLTLDQITQIAVNALEDVKGDNIVVIDTHKLSSLFSKMIVEFKANNIVIIGVEGEAGGEWVLVDCGDIVVHVMLPQVRNYYDLESLWNGQRPTTQS